MSEPNYKTVSIFIIIIIIIIIIYVTSYELIWGGEKTESES